MKKDVRHYFKSKKAMYKFILLETDGATRVKLLGVNNMHYKSKKVATKWFDEIHVVIKDDEEVCKELKKIYDNMVDYED